MPLTVEPRSYKKRAVSEPSGADTSKRIRYPNSFQFWGEQGTRRVFSFRARPRFLSRQRPLPFWDRWQLAIRLLNRSGAGASISATPNQRARLLLGYGRVGLKA